MPNFGWREGLKDPTARWSKEVRGKSKILQQVAQGLDVMQVFQHGGCTSPVQCDQPTVVLSAVLVGDSIAIGLYCIDHATLIKPMLKLVKEVMTDGSVQ